MKFSLFKRINRYILILVMILISFTTHTNYTSADQNKLIKVGYTNINGFIESKDGEYKGYAYVYLREIAKYTGWEYKFIEMNQNELRDSIKDGEVDIAAGMIKNEESAKIYDFPGYDMGNTYTILTTLKSNANINRGNYSDSKNFRVGYFENNSSELESFNEFCKENEINNIELIPYHYKEGESLVDKLESKEVDAIIHSDLSIDCREKILAKFGAIPYYFATTKGNEEIISGIDYAISKIIESNPDFDKRLYNKYFEGNKDYSFVLTEEERKYIENMPTLKAVYLKNNIPTQYYDEKEKKAKGIYIDYINLLSKKSGLKIDLIGVKSYEEGYRMIKDKKADLIIAMPNLYPIADKYNITLTSSYLKADLVDVVRKDNEIINKDSSNNHVVALPYGYGYEEFNKGYKIVRYNSFKECIDAVAQGKADFTYGNEYNINYHLINGYYPNLNTISKNYRRFASIGLAKPTDLTLMEIINKISHSIQEDEMKTIIYNNTMNIKSNPTLKQFFISNIELCIGIILFILITVSISIFLIVKMKFDKIKKSKEILFKKTQTDSLTGLYNREACERLITEYLNNKEKSLYGVFIIIDIDYFKQINDNLGHKIGDKVLIEFAKLLKEIFSHKDITCRLGGDEFIVFMVDIEKNNLERVSQKLKELCEMMNQDIEYNGKVQKISLSVGAIITKDAIAFEKLYHMADEVLYEVKRKGKNGFEIKSGKYLKGDINEV